MHWNLASARAHVGMYARTRVLVFVVWLQALEFAKRVPKPEIKPKKVASSSDLAGQVRMSLRSTWTPRIELPP